MVMTEHKRARPSTSAHLKPLPCTAAIPLAKLSPEAKRKVKGWEVHATRTGRDGGGGWG